MRARGNEYLRISSMRGNNLSLRRLESRDSPRAYYRACLARDDVVGRSTTLFIERKSQACAVRKAVRNFTRCAISSRSRSIETRW